MGDERVPGPRRSLQTLETLRLTQAGFEPRAGRTIGDLRWRPAQSYSIQRDDRREVWHAGHVSALLSDDFIVIAGTQTGGVWLLTPVVTPHFRQGHQAVPLSDSWDTPDVSCLAYGPDGSQQVFVGCGSGWTIPLIELKTILGGMEHVRTTNIPIPVSGVSTIVVFPQPRRIVIATSVGVWWSPVPTPASNAAGYSWQMGQGLPSASFSGLAAGPGESVAAAVSGVAGTADSFGLFRGVWDNSVLSFTRAMISGANATLMRRTSVASCDGQRQRMYAVAAADDSSILTVLASVDGGATWQAVAIPANHGNLGFYNNCLGVSPYRPNVVALGWRSGGPFFSRDSGASWQQINNDTNNGHLHSDLHALYFARNAFEADHLYVGSDGGIAVTNDLGQTFVSQFNRPLNNLQFYIGNFTASARFPGLLAGGTQDNGNIYLFPDHDAGSVWRTLEGGDGGLNRLIDPLSALLRFNNTLLVNGVEIGNRVRIAPWNAQNRSFDGGLGTIVPVDGDTAGMTPSSLEVVLAPSRRRNGQLMYAMAGTSTGAVYGFFANADGSDAKLSRLGTVGDAVSGLASFDGSSILVGTTTGRLFRVESATGAATEQTLPAAAAAVTRIEVFLEPRGPFTVPGVRPVQAYALRGGALLHFNGTNWRLIGGGWATYDIERETGRLFAANDSDVFQSSDGGVTWQDASQGLPVRPHCSDLRIAPGEQGGRDLYLATYGRSVWRTAIALPPPSDSPFEVPPLAAEILFGVIQDGGGIVRIGGRLHRVPPTPPIRDLLVSVVLHDVAGAMSSPHSQAVRRTVLEGIVHIAQEELQRLGRG